jgi:hypothetical protein
MVERDPGHVYHLFRAEAPERDISAHARAGSKRSFITTMPLPNNPRSQVRAHDAGARGPRANSCRCHSTRLSAMMSEWFSRQH